jgi:hypothetical protein
MLFNEAVSTVKVIQRDTRSLRNVKWERDGRSILHIYYPSSAWKESRISGAVRHPSPYQCLLHTEVTQSPPTAAALPFTRSEEDIYICVGVSVYVRIYVCMCVCMYVYLIV